MIQDIQDTRYWILDNSYRLRKADTGYKIQVHCTVYMYFGLYTLQHIRHRSIHEGRHWIQDTDLQDLFIQVMYIIWNTNYEYRISDK